MKKRVENQLSLTNESKSENTKNEKSEKGVLDSVMILEHDPVYTIGFREEANLPAGEKERLEKFGADFAIADRGGGVTFHGPGQLIVYPILNLRNYDMPIKTYVRNLEEIGILCCNHFNIEAKRTENPGVWVGNNKIVSIGVRNQNLITSHGIAFNCNIDLKWFSHIVPCGLFGKGSTSLSNECKEDVTIERLVPVLLGHFERIFKCRASETFL